MLFFCCFPCNWGGPSFFFLFEPDDREIELLSGSPSFELSSELLLREERWKSSQESTLEELKLSKDSSPLLACVAVFSVSSWREKTRAKGKSREHMGREQKEEWGEGVGRKGKACSWAFTFYQTPFVHEREAIRHNDWPIARQSKRSMSTACQ